MLTYLLLCLLTQVKNEPSKIMASDKIPIIKPYDVVETEKLPPPVKLPKECSAVDKFGRRWTCFNPALLRDKIQEVNQLPWEMKDDEGVSWKHQDKSVLENFVKQRNYNNKVSKELFLQWNTPQQLQKYNPPAICVGGT